MHPQGGAYKKNRASLASFAVTVVGAPANTGDHGVTKAGRLLAIPSGWGERGQSVLGAMQQHTCKARSVIGSVSGFGAPSIREEDA